MGRISRQPFTVIVASQVGVLPAMDLLAHKGLTEFQRLTLFLLIQYQRRRGPIRTSQQTRQQLANHVIRAHH